MKKIISKISLVLICLLSLSSCNSSDGKLIQFEDIDKYQALMYEGRPGKKSADGLQITRRVDFLNANDQAYLNYLEFADTKNTNLGYAIEDKQSGEIIEYSNDGGQVLGEVLEMSGLAYEDAEAGKVYYLSPFDIYLKLNDGRIYNLLPESGIYPSLENEETFEKVLDKARK